MGGLLDLHRTGSTAVPYVGRCPGGAFAVDARGTLLWVADWGYMTSVEVSGAELKLQGKPADLLTGRLK